MDPWPKVAKVECLPVEEDEFGFFQRASFTNHDLYHEEVIEMETPFDVVASSSGGTVTRTVVLVGDQNAGKSTFLHSFLHSSDWNYTRLMQRLPVLQAHFLNARFLPEQEARDELPFLDTDLARTTLLVGLDDWNVLLEEEGYEGLESSHRGGSYLCLQLIELGGDHLDRMMHLEAIEDAKLKALCAQSLALMRRAHRVVYVTNGQTFDERVVAERLAFLQPSELSVYLSREQTSDQRRIVEAALGREVKPFRVLTSEGHLNVEAILETVCQVVQSAEVPNQTTLFVEHLVAFWKSWSHDFDGESLSLWITEEAFHEHFSDDGAFQAANVVPASSLVAGSAFVDARDALVRRGLALPKYGALTSRFALQLIRPDGTVVSTWMPPAEPGPPALRFPLWPPLFACLLEHRAPAHFWLEREPSCVPDHVVSGLEQRILQAVEQQQANVLVILLDEWQLTRRQQVSLTFKRDQLIPLLHQTMEQQNDASDAKIVRLIIE